jgi:DNA topoisomerase-1
VVRDVSARRTERRPPPPYTTSTLQQDASRKLRLSAKQAMDAAQALFEAGAITYHRTDSTRVSDEAQTMARQHIAAHHPEALPERAPRARVAAAAQDAHEAIRPTKLSSEEVPTGPAARLYAMIKARFLASQSKPATFDKTTVLIDSGPVPWAAEGSVLLDAGFLTFWGPYARQEDVVLPKVVAGQTLTADALRVLEKSTQPPPRYDQGALIKKLETSGIGRPATFAGIIDTLLQREYVRELKAARGKAFLQPTEFGLQVDGLMTSALPELVSERYTAEMEGKLDEIERGDATRPRYLRAWYDAFREAMGRAATLGAEYRAAHGLTARAFGGGRGSRGGAGDEGSATGEETATRCDRCGEANYRKIARKKGRGSFLACPACRMTRNVRAKVRPGGCPTCGSALVEKSFGKGPAFWGCVRYGAAERPCSYRESAEGKPAKARATGGPRWTRSATDKGCPRCGKAKLAIVTPTDPAAGAPFYACDDAACKFTLPLGARRRRAPCPACGAVVLERRRKPAAGAAEPGAPFWSCARYPECSYTAPWTAPAVAPLSLPHA